jgi:hypothetical protein
VNFLGESDQVDVKMRESWTKDILLMYSCNDYWTVEQVLNATNLESNIPNSNNTGIAFFTFSSKIAPSYFRFTLVTFYISIVLVIGKVLRSVIDIGANKIFIFEIPDSERILMLCECIHINRMRGRLEE